MVLRGEWDVVVDCEVLSSYLQLVKQSSEDEDLHFGDFSDDALAECLRFVSRTDLIEHGVLSENSTQRFRGIDC
jgi:hypothetical protein